MGNKLLLVCPFFYGYQNLIVQELTQKGYTVFWKSEFPLKTPKKYFFFEKIIGVKKIMWLQYERHIKNLITENNINSVLLIRGRHWPETLIKWVSCNCDLIQYQWDSIANNPNSMVIKKYARKSYTFDIMDAKRIDDYFYLPLFFAWEKNVPELTLKGKYDILFVASWSNERFKELNEIKNYCIDKGRTIYYFICIPLQTIIRRLPLLRIVNFSDLKLNPMPRKQYSLLLQESIAVFDVPSRTQTGSSMRTIEALSLGKKVITTNEYVKNESFYHPDNILIWPAEKEQLDRFLDSPFNDYSKQRVLSIQEWTKAVLA